MVDILHVQKAVLLLVAIVITVNIEWRNLTKLFRGKVFLI